LSQAKPSIVIVRFADQSIAAKGHFPALRPGNCHFIAATVGRAATVSEFVENLPVLPQTT